MPITYEDARNSLLDIGTSSVLISPARVRNEMVITNTSAAAQNITLSFGSPAVSKVGVYLAPYSAWFASNTSGFNVWNGDIFAISDAASGLLSVFER